MVIIEKLFYEKDIVFSQQLFLKLVLWYILQLQMLSALLQEKSSIVN